MSQSTELMIDINVQDGASAQFKKIGQAAQQMGQQAEQAGGRAGGAFARLQEATRQNALGLGLLSGSFGLFARATRDAERNLMTLDRTYGDTADSLRDFGDELQRTTTFSSEQAVEAANVFGTLQRNYGLTADEIQNLIQVSADLAAVNGITLTDAAERVQAAIRGEAESAEALGLTMNETAIGLAGVSAGMSEAEKAAFRYDALLEQATFSTGAAAEQANTTAGRMTQLTNTIQDAGREFVNFTGPIGSAVAGLSNMSLEAGMALSGFSAMPAVLKTATVAVRGLMVAMGPIGLGLAVTAAITSFILLRDKTDEYKETAEETQAAVVGLSDRLMELATSSLRGSQMQNDILQITSDLAMFGAELGLTRQAADQYQQSLANLEGTFTEISVTDFLSKLDQETKLVVQSLSGWDEAASDLIITEAELINLTNNLYNEFDKLVLGGESAADVVSLVDQIMVQATGTGINTAEVMGDVAAAINTFKETGDFTKLINDLQGIKTEIEQTGVALRNFPRASFTEDLAFADQQRQFEESGAAAAEYTRELYAGDIAIAEYRAGVAALNDPLAAQQRQMEANGRAAADYGAGMDEATQATAEAEQAILAAAIELAGLNDSLTLLTTIGAGLGMERVGDDMVNVMTAAQGAALAINALADGFQVLVQNPVAWGREAQAVADWATSVMLGVDGVNSLSDLWGRGQIETITYNRGIEAQNRILDANADIQNDVARIQAKQLPIMADLIEQQAEYIDGIADLDPKNQVAALGFMDVGKAAQAQSLMMLAAEGAAAGYGSGLAQMSEQIIVAAAQADPVLKAMLEDMGLIREGAEGEIVVNFARAGGLNNDIQRLIASIDALTIALGGIPPYTEAVVDVRYNVNGRPALPGEIGFSQFATGGTVTHRVASATPMFATAATGRTTLVGEAGPELVTLPTGSQVTSSPATMDRLRSRPMQGSGGGVYFYGPVTLQPASTDVESAIRREALSGSRGY